LSLIWLSIKTKTVQLVKTYIQPAKIALSITITSLFVVLPHLRYDLLQYPADFSSHLYRNVFYYFFILLNCFIRLYYSQIKYNRTFDLHYLTVFLTTLIVFLLPFLFLLLWQRSAAAEWYLGHSCHLFYQTGQHHQVLLDVCCVWCSRLCV
jgi:hypothetical protein